MTLCPSEKFLLLDQPLASSRKAFGSWPLAESFWDCGIRRSRYSIADLPITRFPDHPILKFLSVAAVIQATAAHGHRGWHLARWSRNGVALIVNLHAQRETHGSKDFLDLIERLAAEVLGLEHLRFRLLHQFADRLDIRVLQAVVTAHRKLQFFHGTVQVFILDQRLLFSTRLGLQLLFKVDEDRHVV